MCDLDDDDDRAERKKRRKVQNDSQKLITLHEQEKGSQGRRA